MTETTDVRHALPLEAPENYNREPGVYTITVTSNCDAKYVFEITSPSYYGIISRIANELYVVPRPDKFYYYRSVNGTRQKICLSAFNLRDFLHHPEADGSLGIYVQMDKVVFYTI